LAQLNALELNDEGDHASVNNNSMVESAIVSQQEKELREINVALGKISTREYGICEMCEDNIGFQRLKVKPHAIYCIDCREIVEKSNK
jgi:DnaK suppressor protein